MNSGVYIFLVLLAIVIGSELWELYHHRCPTCKSRDISYHYIYGQWCNACKERET